MSKSTQAPQEHRCRATTKRGTPCAATVVGPDGLCSAHSGRQDMRELGRKGGRSRRSALAGMTAERQSLRAYLRETVDPAEVWQALKAALESGSQTAVVSAARLLVTELYEDRAEEDQAQRMKQAGADARAKIAQLLANRADPPQIVRGRRSRTGDRAPRRRDNRRAASRT